jgi:hypothetical protein
VQLIRRMSFVQGLTCEFTMAPRESVTRRDDL